MVYSEDFEHFWRVYPKKTGKGAAYKKWGKLTIEEKRKAYKDVQDRVRMHEPWKRDNGRFVPNCETYLNQRRFDDEIQQETAQESGKVGSTISPWKWAGFETERDYIMALRSTDYRIVMQAMLGRDWRQRVLQYEQAGEVAVDDEQQKSWRKLV